MATVSDDQIIDAAERALGRRAAHRLWMTARGLARRLTRDGCPVSQVRLYNVLADHAERAQPRRIRNSPSPSAQTLEVLWGAVRKVDEREVEPPRKRDSALDIETFMRRQSASAESLGREADDEPVDLFLSYNFGDSERAAEVTERLEQKGYSVWMAGNCIACGEVINDSVRSAIERAHGLLLYLSATSLTSLWVAKEQLVGLRQEKPRTIIARGDDDDLMGLVAHWMEGGDDEARAGDFGGLLRIDGGSYNVAASFREQLRRELEDERSTIFVHPDAAAPSERLVPLSDFPEQAV